MHSKNTIINKSELINYILAGCKKPDNLKIGIEFENFLYNNINFANIPYDDNTITNIKTILSNLKNQHAWQAVEEQGNIIGLTSDIGVISLEPAGQFEFSSAPALNLNILNNWVATYFKQILPLLEQSHIGMFSLGYNPKYNVEQLPLVPKKRYSYMYDYMPQVGSLGRNMMKTTATLQANIDYISESDLNKKMKVATALQPFFGALYANSPFVDGKDCGLLSYRNQVWLDTDNNRSGLLEFVLDGSFSVEKYVDYALNVPLYYIYRHGEYIQPNEHVPFYQYFDSSYKIADATPILEDFIMHLGTLFPDVRLKQYIEVRSADCVDPDLYLSLGALMVGIMYDNSSLDYTYNLLNKFSYQDLLELKTTGIKEGLKATINNKNIQPILQEILNAATEGLQKRNLGEEKYLIGLEEIIQSGITLAERNLSIYQKNNNNIDKLIENIAIKNYPSF